MYCISLRHCPVELVNLKNAMKNTKYHLVDCSTFSHEYDVKRSVDEYAIELKSYLNSLFSMYLMSTFLNSQKLVSWIYHCKIIISTFENYALWGMSNKFLERTVPLSRTFSWQNHTHMAFLQFWGKLRSGFLPSN